MVSALALSGQSGDMVVSEGIEPPQPRRVVYSHLGSPMPSNTMVGDAGIEPAAARFQTAYAPLYTYPRWIERLDSDQHAEVQSLLSYR